MYDDIANDRRQSRHSRGFAATASQGTRAPGPWAPVPVDHEYAASGPMRPR